MSEPLKALHPRAAKPTLERLLQQNPLPVSQDPMIETLFETFWKPEISKPVLSDAGRLIQYFGTKQSQREDILHQLFDFLNKGTS